MTDQPPKADGDPPAPSAPAAAAVPQVKLRDRLLPAIAAAFGPLPGTEGANSFETNLATRFNESKPLEGAVTYIDRVIDRQLNKARGLLSFNSILLAALNFEHSCVPHWPEWASILALVSSVPLLLLMLVVWGQPSRFATAADDLKATVTLSCWRGYALVFSFLFSLAAVAISILITVWKLTGAVTCPKI